MPDAHAVERSAAAAWPAGRTEVAEGWLLRHTPGVPRKRSNSALPPGPGERPERALDVVETFYRAAGQPVVVQVSPAEAHGVLDAALASRGYRREAPTLVLTAPPATVIARTAPPTTVVVGAGPAAALIAGAGPAAALIAGAGPAAALIAGAGPVDVVIDEADRADWLAAYRVLNGPADTSAVVERVLARVPGPAAFARVVLDGRPAAIGMFAAPEGPAAPQPTAEKPAGGEWAGVFCMATARDHRRRGLALAVLGAGARWAAARGCAGMYLQVEQDNIAARHLYARTGFVHSHSYHYRVLDDPGS